MVTAHPPGAHEHPHGVTELAVSLRPKRGLGCCADLDGRAGVERLRGEDRWLRRRLGPLEEFCVVTQLVRDGSDLPGEVTR